MGVLNEVGGSCDGGDADECTVLEIRVEDWGRNEEVVGRWE
jgi:hypothetical protein